MKPRTAPWHQCILLLVIVFVTIIFSPPADGQETLIVGDEAETAADNDATALASDGMGDVNMMEDAITQFTEHSDARSTVIAKDVVDDDILIEDEATETTTDDDSEIPTNAADSITKTESTKDDAKPVEDDVGAIDDASDSKQESQPEVTPVGQVGPYIDLLGDVLLSLEMVDETHAQVHQHYTNEALSGKKVVGLYFSADWCGPCRQFTPDLVNFYNKMNSRRGKKNEFEIVWISRCRTVDAFGQYFTQMNWLALPPNEAMGQRGQYLGEKFKVKSIPTLVLLDEIGNVITTDARNKIPMDMAGIGFPWRSPISILVSTLVPKSFRLLVKSQISGVINMVKRVIVGKRK